MEKKKVIFCLLYKKGVRRKTIRKRKGNSSPKRERASLSLGLKYTDAIEKPNIKINTNAGSLMK